MNFKTTYILFGVLVLMLAGLAVVLWQGPATPAGDKLVFPSFKDKKAPVSQDDIVKVVIERLQPAGNTLVFEKTDSTWRITEPRALPADGSAVTNLIDALASAKVDDETKVGDARQTGLASPTRTVKLVTKEGKELTLTVGGVTEGGNLAVAYVMSSDRPRQRLAVKRESIATALEGLNYFRAKDLIGGETADLQQITLSRGDRKVVLRKDLDRWRMTEPAYGEANITELLGGLGRLTASHFGEKESDFVKDQVPASELGKYGLDKNVLRIAVTRGEGKSATKTLLVSEKKDGEKLFATVETGPKGPFDIVKISPSAIEPFTKVFNDPESLRSKALVDLAAGKQLDAIDIEEGGSRLEFRREGMDWKLSRGTQVVQADDAEVRKLVDALTKRDAIVAFVDPKTQPKPREHVGVDRPDVVTLRLYADSFGRPDDKKKDAKPKFNADKLVATLKLGVKRDAGVGAERLWPVDGPKGKKSMDSTLVYVSPELADLARRGAVAYLEKNVEPFNPGRVDQGVTRVEVTRDGTKYELTRATMDAPWTFAAPASLKGMKASDSGVRSLLMAFNRPTILSIEAEKAADLRPYGLVTPEVRLVVTKIAEKDKEKEKSKEKTKDQKPTTHVYELGKTTDKGVYLKLGDKDTIYLANKLLATEAKQELRDPTIFNYKADDAVALKVTRYSDDEGAAVTWSFEKKGGQWARVGGPANFPVDQEHVKDLLTELSTLRADKFVPAAKGIEVNRTDRAMRLEVTTADKKTYTVTIGAPEGTTSYYATSPQHPGTAFLVPQAPLKALKDSFSYLRKG